jgi:16S rRNA processing protein RimM
MKQGSGSNGPLLEVGVLSKPHGVRGEVKLHLHNPGSSLLSVGDSRFVGLALDGAGKQVEIEVTAASGGDLVIRVAGVQSRDQAEALRGARVLVSREQDVELEEGQYYYVDLIGCVVVDEEDREVGAVGHVFEAGASDVLVVRRAGQERYIPLVDDWVTEVDLSLKRIRIRGDVDQWDSWPE